MKNIISCNIIIRMKYETTSATYFYLFRDHVENILINEDTILALENMPYTIQIQV